MGRRAKRQAENLAEDAEGAWEKLKGQAGAEGSALKRGLQEAARG